MGSGFIRKMEKDILRDEKLVKVKKEILGTLRPFKDEKRRRIMRAVAEFYGIDLT